VPEGGTPCTTGIPGIAGVACEGVNGVRENFSAVVRCSFNASRSSSSATCEPLSRINEGTACAAVFDLSGI
jgi:hypothetical protein